MISDFLDIIIGIGVEVLTRLAQVSGSLYGMEHVWNHTNGDKGVTVFIKVNPPGIACSLTEQFKLLRNGMVSPYSGVQFDPLLIRSSGLTHVGMGEYPVGTVQPTIGPPAEVIQHFVGILRAPAIQHYLWRSGRLIIFFVNGDKYQFRSSS